MNSNKVLRSTFGEIWQGDEKGEKKEPYAK